jgi:hypothetical protein
MDNKPDEALSKTENHPPALSKKETKGKKL